MSAPITKFFQKASPTSSSLLSKRSLSSSVSPPSKKAKGPETSKDAVDPSTSSAVTTLSASPNITLSLEPGWSSQLDSETKKSYFKSLYTFLASEERSKQIVYPPPKEVFTAFSLCPFSTTKVVIIGQDPYHGPGQAHGLAFSVQDGVGIPPSLRNIYKEIESDLGVKMSFKSGNLSNWAKQGVLMLNAVLTVRKGEPNSHKGKGWEKFTDHVIKVLNEEKEGLVFLLWGKPAQKKAEFVNRKKHHVITSSHPSPLGATKTNEPFIGSKCFSRANAFLEQQNQQPIDWKL